MTDQRKPDDNDTEAKPAEKDQVAQAEVQDVPLVGKTEEIDPATVDAMIEDRFEATDN
jgi:hypothetical protein